MSMSNLEGVLLSDYLLVQCLSKGEMADVYYARQQSVGNDEVAVKIYRSRNAQQAAFRDYFMVEEEKIGQLDHPNILPLLEFGEGDGLVYAVTPYIVGGTLDDLLRRVGGRVSATQALPMLQQLCSAVQYAHSLNRIHGNIKASNIFVAPDGRMLLSDFGIVRDYPNRQVALNDISALGVLLYRMITGQASVEEQFRYVKQQPLAAHMLVPDISEAVAGVLSRALQKHAANRFTSAEALSQAFFVAVTSPSSASPIPVAKPVHLLSPVSATAFHPSNSQTPGEMSFVDEGDCMSRQHFWSVEPIEWSPLPLVQGAAQPVSADEYLRNTPVAAVPIAASPHPPRIPARGIPTMDEVAPTVPSSMVGMPLAGILGGNDEGSLAGILARMSNVLPIIVVIVLILGLLVAFLSSFIYPT